MKYLHINLLACILSTSLTHAGKHLDQHPFDFDVPTTLVKADPEKYRGRIAKPSAVIDLFKHKNNSKAILSVAGKKVGFDFATIKSGAHVLSDEIKKTYPEAKSIKVESLKISSRDYIVCRFKMMYEGKELQIINFITHEGKSQYHFTISYPVGAPKQVALDLLGVMGTIKSKSSEQEGASNPAPAQQPKSEP